MQPHIISGSILLPTAPKQKQLHRNLGGFADWMQRTKDAAEIQKDRQQPVPIAMLPMVF